MDNPVHFLLFEAPDQARTRQFEIAQLLAPNTHMRLTAVPSLAINSAL